MGCTAHARQTHRQVAPAAAAAVAALEMPCVHQVCIFGSVPNVCWITELMAADGTELMAADGTELMAADGTELMAADGTELMAADGTELMAADGTELMAADQRPGRT